MTPYHFLFEVAFFGCLLVLVDFALEPFDEFGEVVEGAEAGLEGLFGHGADVDIADEGGAVELAEEGLKGDVDAHEEVVALGVVGMGDVACRQVGEGHTETYDVGLLVVFELHEGHFGCLETVAVEKYAQVLAFGLAEGDEFPPVDVGGIVDKFNDVAEEVEVAFGADGECAAVGSLLADLAGEAGAVFSEVLLQLVEESVAACLVEVVEHGEGFTVGREPLPEDIGFIHNGFYNTGYLINDNVSLLF